jgi:hypothetical protein
MLARIVRAEASVHGIVACVAGRRLDYGDPSNDASMMVGSNYMFEPSIDIIL